MRAILGGAGLLLLVGAIDPLGAYGLTIESQFKRLTALLERNGILKDGVVTLPGKLLEGGAAGDGYSIVYALRDAGGLQRLAPWFRETKKHHSHGECDRLVNCPGGDGTAQIRAVFGRP